MKFFKPGLISAICLTIALSGCGGEDARKAAFLEKGKAYLAEGNYDKAKVELKNVLQIDPKFAEGYYTMGLLEEKRQNLRRAFANYRKAAELDPTHIKAQAKVGRFYAIGGDMEKAQETLDAIFAIDPASMDGKLLKMIILARTDEKKAIDYTNSIISEDPTQIDAVRMLAMLYTKNKDNDKAISVLKKGIEAQPKERMLWMQLAETYARADDFKNAEATLKNIINLDPENISSYINLASFYAQRDELDKAEETFRKIISIAPENEKGYLLLAEFQARRRSVSEAEKTLISAIEKNPDIYSLRFSLAKLYRATKSGKETDVYNEIINRSGFEPEGLKARNELAKIAMGNEDIKGATKLIKEVLDANPRDNTAWLLKGKIALAQKDYNGAISAFRTVVKEQPDLVEAVQLLAFTHLKNNEPELAEEVLRRGVENAPETPGMYINYARHLQNTGKTEEAEKEIDKLLQIKPRQLEALKMKAKFAVARKDMDDFKGIIETIKTTYPGIPDGYQQMGDYHAANKQYEKALKEYETALKHSKSLLPSLASITKVYLAQKQFDKAIARLNEAINKQPENAIPFELLGEVYIAQKKLAKAEKSIRKAMELNPKWPLPYSGLATIYLTQKNMDGAIRTYKQALEILPNDTQIMAKLAQIYERQHDYKNAMKVYENILDIDPENALAANNLAVMLADKAGDPASLQRAKELATRFEKSSNPGFLDTIGWIYYKTGEMEKAIPILEKVVQKAGNIPVFQYHLGMAYHKSGDREAAKLHLNKALESGSKFQGREEAKQILKDL
ncbi:MAG TPA: tetratricopeptide repeat protein [Gammaproteobacteria bacterium]|nr:tetratricopeptide repeat protein [Gammaproteobacteria bacterium]